MTRCACSTATFPATATVTSTATLAHETRDNGMSSLLDCLKITLKSAARAPSHHQLDDFRLHLGARYDDPRERDRQLDSPRAGAAGIEVEHALAHRNRGPVRMPIDHRCQAGGRRIEVELGNIVE